MYSETSQYLAHLVLVAILGLLSVVTAGVGDGGSRCPDSSCKSAPDGVQCDPRYDRDDGCCPVWYCNDGQQVYENFKDPGVGSSYRFSSGSSSAGGFPAIGPSGLF